MTDITTLFWILSAVVVLMAAVLKGITGFGFALFSLPLLSLFMPVHMLIPAMSLFNLLASIYLLIQIKVKLEARYFIPMFLASLVGIPFGVYALQHFNETLLRFLVGLVIVVFSLLLYFGNNKEPRLKSKPIVFAGFISGLLGSSVSLSGPPIALAMNRKKYTKDLFRSLFAVFGVLSSFFTLVGYALEGIVLAASVKFTAFLFPLLMVGSKLGDRWARNLKQDKFRKIVIALNFFTGVAVIVTILVKTL